MEWARRELEFHADALQARILRTTSKRVILNCCRQWGKSTVTSAKALFHAQHQAESLVVVVSPSARQSGEFVRKVKSFAGRMGIQAKGDGHNAMSLALANGSRIVGLPGNETTVRGFSAVGLLLIDEASRVSDELYHALRPMLAASNGDLWLMSTPHGKRRFFWEEWEHGGPQWERVQARATDCSRIRPEFLAEERAALGEDRFRQEYLCEFVDTASGMFSRAAVERAFCDDFEPLEV